MAIAVPFEQFRDLAGSYVGHPDRRASLAVGGEEEGIAVGGPDIRFGPAVELWRHASVFAQNSAIPATGNDVELPAVGLVAGLLLGAVGEQGTIGREQRSA